MTTTTTRVMTLKAGQLGHGWHAVHLSLAALTYGLWLLVYGAHALISAHNRATVTVDVPDGARIEYRDGYPNVLMPDEYLEPRTPREWASILLPYLVPLLVVIIVTAARVRA